MDELVGPLLRDFVAWVVTHADGVAFVADMSLVEAALRGYTISSWRRASEAAARLAALAVQFEGDGLLVSAFDALAEAWMLQGGSDGDGIF